MSRDGDRYFAECHEKCERLRALLAEAAPWLRPDDESPPALAELYARVVRAADSAEAGPARD